MKINGYNHVNMTNPYKNNQDKQQAAKQGQKQDQVEISSQAKQMQVNQSIASNRQDKVAKLKQQVESGTYQVKPQEVANKFYEFWSK